MNRLSISMAYAAIAIYATGIAVQLPANILGDDAAITFRYAARAASGLGLTYNDHERVLGASNPLYTLCLAGAALVGWDIESAARVLGVALFAGASLVSAALARQLSGSAIGLVAGVFLPTIVFFRLHALSGMESILAAYLGLFATCAILTGRETLAGVLLGLAVWNKLDAGLLALAMVAAWLIVLGRWPARIVGYSVIVAAPWFGFSWWYYGSPVPHSLLTKIARGRVASTFNHFWIVEFFEADRLWILVGLAAAGYGLRWGTWSSRQRLAATTLGAWFVVHLAAFSVVSLGEYYPWYLVALIPPVVVLALAAAGSLLRLGSRTVSSWGVALALVVTLAWVAEPQLVATRSALLAGNPLRTWEAFDADRRLAGIFLSQYSDPHEIIQSGFGWPAFEVGNPFNDEAQLSSRQMRQPAAYSVYHGTPYDKGAVPPAPIDGQIPLATFNLASDLFPELSWFTVFGSPESRIARRGPRYRQLRLFELDPPLPFSAELGVGNVAVTGVNLQAEPPSGAMFSVDTEGQPAALVFTPVVLPQAEGLSVVYEIRLRGGDLAFQRTVRAGERLDPIAVRVSEPNAASATFSLLMKRDQAVGHVPSGAMWANVKIVVGDAKIDAARLRNPALIEAWRRHNPIPP